LETLVAAAAVPVEAVANRVLPIVALMVVLCSVERRRRNDLRDDRARYPQRFGRLLLRLFGESLLFLVVVEDRRAVLVAAVAELPGGVGGIDGPPEDLHQGSVAHLSLI